MPEPEKVDVKPSWAEQVEQGDDEDLLDPLHLPSTTEEYDKSRHIKKVTEWKLDDDGKRVKIVKSYRVETKRVPKSIAQRKLWKKFGASANDPPGPNTASTIIGEEVFLNMFNSLKNQESDQNRDPNNLKATHNRIACRLCKGDHWTNMCPFKDKLESLGVTEQNGLALDVNKATPDISGGAAARAGVPSSGGTSGKYVVPSRRAGAPETASRGPRDYERENAATIRVTNISEETRESDLQDLFSPFGQIKRIYLHKDKLSGMSKGFAFITFSRRDEAANAIAGVDKYGYDHLVLRVQWSKPSGHQDEKRF